MMCVCVNYRSLEKSFDRYVVRYSGALHLQAIVVDEDLREVSSLFVVTDRCLFLFL